MKKFVKANRKRKEKKLCGMMEDGTENCYGTNSTHFSPERAKVLMGSDISMFSQLFPTFLNPVIHLDAVFSKLNRSM